MHLTTTVRNWFREWQWHMIPKSSADFTPEFQQGALPWVTNVNQATSVGRLSERIGLKGRGLLMAMDPAFISFPDSAVLSYTSSKSCVPPQSVMRGQETMDHWVGGGACVPCAMWVTSCRELKWHRWFIYTFIFYLAYSTRLKWRTMPAIL